MADDSHNALPGLQLLFSQCPPQVRQHEQLMRQSALTKRCSAYFPPSRSTWKHCVNQPLIGAFFEAITQSNLCGLQTDQPFRWRVQQPFAGAVDQAEAAFTIEGEH